LRRVEFIKQIFLLVPFLLLGMHSGYLYVYYADKREFHVPLLVTGCLVGFLSFGLLLLYTNNVLVSCAVLSLIMAIVIEKILVSYGSLILASLYKALVSGVLIIGAVFVYVFDLNISSYSFYSLSFVFGFFAWLLLVFLYSNFFCYPSSTNVIFAKDRLFANDKVWLFYLFAYIFFLLVIYCLIDL
jgi:hypothetical protein